MRAISLRFSIIDQSQGAVVASNLHWSLWWQATCNRKWIFGDCGVADTLMHAAAAYITGDIVIFRSPCNPSLNVWRKKVMSETDNRSDNSGGGGGWGGFGFRGRYRQTARLKGQWLQKCNKTIKTFWPKKFFGHKTKPTTPPKMAAEDSRKIWVENLLQSAREPQHRAALGPWN